MRKSISGFTIVELTIVVFIIGLLTTIGTMSYVKITAQSRDSQRSSKVTIIIEALEKYYETHGQYPSCTDMTQDSNTVVSTTLTGMNQDALTAPNANEGTNSITCFEPTSNNVFGYIDGGAQYSIKYINEETNNMINITSRHRTS
ncbi:MAG: hypothetical protein PWQ10_205 [Patescibacteria group bacterium]|nr:hypothetical protein [Patescibacteria group bacterium]